MSIDTGKRVCRWTRRRQISEATAYHSGRLSKHPLSKDLLLNSGFEGTHDGQAQ